MKEYTADTAEIQITAAAIERALSKWRFSGNFVWVNQLVELMDLNPFTVPEATKDEIRAWLKQTGWPSAVKNINGIDVYGYVVPAPVGGVA